MKPIYQTGRPARDGESPTIGHVQSKSPITDWSFQATAPTLRGGSSFLREGKRSFLPKFSALSQGFFEVEAKREYRFEAALFGVIVTLSAWPMVLAARAAFELIK